MVFACWVVRVTTPDNDSLSPHRSRKRVAQSSSVRLSSERKESGVTAANIYNGNPRSASGSFLPSRPRISYSASATPAQISMGSANSTSGIGGLSSGSGSTSAYIHSTSASMLNSYSGGASSSSAQQSSHKGSYSASGNNSGFSVGLSLPSFASSSSSLRAGGSSSAAEINGSTEKNNPAAIRGGLYTSRFSSGSPLSAKPLNNTFNNIGTETGLYDLGNQWLLASNKNIGRRKIIDWSNSTIIGENTYYWDDEGGEDGEGGWVLPTYPDGTPIDPLNPPTVGENYDDGAGNFFTWNGTSFIYHHSEANTPVGNGIYLMLLLAAAMAAMRTMRKSKEAAEA